MSKIADIETKTPISTEGHSNRLWVCLKAEGITNYEDLLSITENQFLLIPNLGRKSLNEMKEYLRTHLPHIEIGKSLEMPQKNFMFRKEIKNLDDKIKAEQDKNLQLQKKCKELIDAIEQSKTHIVYLLEALDNEIDAKAMRKAKASLSAQEFLMELHRKNERHWK